LTFHSLIIYEIYPNSVNCTKFGQSILRKIIKIVATKRHILRLKCTQFDFGWGSAPDPAGELIPLRYAPLLDCREPTSKGREGKISKAEGKEREGNRGGEIWPLYFPQRWRDIEAYESVTLTDCS